MPVQQLQDAAINWREISTLAGPAIALLVQAIKATMPQLAERTQDRGVQVAFAAITLLATILQIPAGTLPPDAIHILAAFLVSAGSGLATYLAFLKGASPARLTREEEQLVKAMAAHGVAEANRITAQIMSAGLPPSGKS